MNLRAEYWRQWNKGVVFGSFLMDNLLMPFRMRRDERCTNEDFKNSIRGLRDDGIVSSSQNLRFRDWRRVCWCWGEWIESRFFRMVKFLAHHRAVVDDHAQQIHSVRFLRTRIASGNNIGGIAPRARFAQSDQLTEGMPPTLKTPQGNIFFSRPPARSHIRQWVKKNKNYDFRPRHSWHCEFESEYTHFATEGQRANFP